MRTQIIVITRQILTESESESELLADDVIDNTTGAQNDDTDTSNIDHGQNTQRSPCRGRGQQGRQLQMNWIFSCGQCTIRML